MTAAPDRCKRLLLVEDDDSLGAALTFAFEADGFQVRCYSAALDLLPECGPARDADCLIIDHRLPHMDGLALLAALRQREVISPAILITTHPDERCHRRASAAGAQIVEKPLLTDELRCRVHQIMAAR